MPTSIKVTSPSGESWEKPLTQEEYKRLKKIGFEGRDLRGIFSAVARPVRTNNWTNFSKDFFLPTVLNFVPLISHERVALKIILFIAALGFDLITFPIRLLTCIPRVIHNYRAETIPFHRYLIDQKVDRNLLEEGQVVVYLQREKLSREPTVQYYTAFNYMRKEHTMQQHWKKFCVNLIDVPASYNSFVQSGRHPV